MKLRDLIFVHWREECALGVSSPGKAETGNSKCSIMTRKVKQFNLQTNLKLLQKKRAS